MFGPDAARTQTTLSITDLTGYHPRMMNFEDAHILHQNIPAVYTRGGLACPLTVIDCRQLKHRKTFCTDSGISRQQHLYCGYGASTKLYSFAHTLGQFTIPKSSFGRFGLHLGPRLQLGRL
jgi:hypothetical protein